MRRKQLSISAMKGESYLAYTLSTENVSALLVSVSTWMPLVANVVFQPLRSFSSCQKRAAYQANAKWVR